MGGMVLQQAGLHAQQTNPTKESSRLTRAERISKIAE